MMNLRTVPECLAEARSFADPLIRDAVAHLPRHMLRIVGYQRGWWGKDGQTSHLAAGSPHWFACITLLSGRAVGAMDERLRPGVVATELLHDAVVIYDDIADNDEIRYGSTAAWKAFGVGPAMTVAIGLQGLAGRALLSMHDDIAIPAARTLDEALGVAVNGQSWDVAQRGRTDTTWDRCLSMSHEKTGGLIAGAAKLGAVLGQAREEEMIALHTYGWWCGLAAQIHNDLEDIWGENSVFGRAREDLRARRITLPVAGALASGGAAARRLAALYDLPRPLTPDEVNEAADLIESSGGRARAVAVRDNAARIAVESLQLLPASSACSELAQLAAVATRRD